MEAERGPPSSLPPPRPAPTPGQELLRRISCWLRPGGKLFVHIFVHRGLPYHYEVQVCARSMYSMASIG